jgi:hypothetical protein
LGKLPRVKRSLEDLVLSLRSGGNQTLLGAALAGLGWLGLADAQAGEPTEAPLLPPTVSSLQERNRRGPKLILRLSDFGARIFAGHTSHSSHSSHRSHASHYSGTSGSVGSASPSPSSASSAATTPSPVFVITEVDQGRRTIKGRDASGAISEFQLRDDTLVGAVSGADQRFDDYSEAHATFPFSLNQKVSLTWKISNGKKVVLRIKQQ